MSKYQTFVFEDYVFDYSAKKLTLHYSYDDVLAFCETYVFDFDFSHESNPELVDRMCQILFFVAGVSYYKAYLAPNIVIRKGCVDADLARFLERTYQKGLGEFFYINNLSPLTKIEFPVTDSVTKKIAATKTAGSLIGLGGGKDSLVSVEILRNEPKIATWSLGHKEQLQPLVDRIGLPHFYVEREWDKSLLELHKQDALNGHVPISAILAATGSVVAALASYKDVIVSNEHSANEPTLIYQSVPINHQYSKSIAFEKDYQAVLSENAGENIRYFSLVRPLSELNISRIFAQTGFDAYSDVFSSCNRAFTLSSDKIYWCGECAKCAFVFLALTPFVERSKLENLWDGKNLLLDPTLDTTYKNLIGIEGEKPLDCVGAIKESRAAMQLATGQYPELKKYIFDLPNNYDHTSLAEHSMPADMYGKLENSISSL